VEWVRDHLKAMASIHNNNHNNNNLVASKLIKCIHNKICHTNNSHSWAGIQCKGCTITKDILNFLLNNLKIIKVKLFLYYI
jgi:hypothetical protein